MKNAIEKIFGMANVMMTSRPNAVGRILEDEFDRKIESVGFDWKGVHTYIINYFVKQKETLLKEVRTCFDDITNQDQKNIEGLLNYFKEGNKKNIEI